MIAPILAVFLVTVQVAPVGGSSVMQAGEAMESRGIDILAVEEALQKLQGIGAVDDIPTWMNRFETGGFFPAEEVKQLFIAVANQFDKAEDVEQAIDILVRNKVLANEVKWKGDLTSKDKVATGVVALAVVAFGKKI